MRRQLSGAGLMVSGFIVCPCHLVVTLPLLASLLAGTALGSFLTHHTGLISTRAGIYFVGALALGYWFWFGPKLPRRDGDAACPTCMPGATQTPVQEPSALREDQPATRR